LDYSEVNLSGIVINKGNRSMLETVNTANWSTLADAAQLTRTFEALKANNLNPIIVNSGDEARQKVLEMIPEGSDVFTATSATLTAIGLPDIINESGRYESIRKKILALGRTSISPEMRSLTATATFAIGSVQAITEQGHVFCVSFGGSQLPAYVYGAEKVIWVVGTQKIAPDTDAAFRRIEEYALPLESDRLEKARGIKSDIGKILITRREVVPGRTTIILVKEALGY
jgi:YkgG family uncharacterized protein